MVVGIAMLLDYAPPGEKGKLSANLSHISHAIHDIVHISHAPSGARTGENCLPISWFWLAAHRLLIPSADCSGTCWFQPWVPSPSGALLAGPGDDLDFSSASSLPAKSTTNSSLCPRTMTAADHSFPHLLSLSVP
jgi:hypothetical protein